MWSQALILFNTLGIPLSHGTTLEHHFTTLFPSQSLTTLALIPSLQLLFLFASPLPVGYIYRCCIPSSNSNSRPWGWKVLFGISIVIAIAAQFALYATQSYIVVLLLQGPVLGTALGACFTISSLVLAGHYRNDVPLVSVQSGFAGFAGAVVYTALTRLAYESSEDNYGARVHLYTGAVTAATLLPAFLLLTRLSPQKEKDWILTHPLHLSIPKHLLTNLKGGGLWFLTGYMLVFSGILVLPFYSIVLLTQPPGLFFPDTATYSVLAMLSVAAISGSAVANIHALRRVGPVNTFVAASVLGGAVCLSPTLYPKLYVVLPLAAVYGVALGAVFSLHMVVAASFLSRKVAGRWEDDMPARVAVGLVLAGLAAFGGVVGAAALIEGSGQGGRIAMQVAGACMGGGGVLVGCARLWRWKTFFYAV